MTPAQGLQVFLIGIDAAGVIRKSIFPPVELIYSLLQVLQNGLGSPIDTVSPTELVTFIKVSILGGTAAPIKLIVL